MRNLIISLYVYHLFQQFNYIAFNLYSGSVIKVVLWGDKVDLFNFETVMNITDEHVVLLITTTYVKSYEGMKLYCFHVCVVEL